jgi:hypothetical protein
MRPIINLTFVSLIKHMDKWHFGYVNDQSDQFTYDELASCDAMLIGRKPYDGAMGPHLLYEVDGTTKGAFDCAAERDQ